MTPLIENILIGLIVGGAVFSLGHRFYQFVTQAGQGSACGTSCGGCANSDKATSTPKSLVQLEMTSENQL